MRFLGDSESQLKVLDGIQTPQEVAEDMLIKSSAGDVEPIVSCAHSCGQYYCSEFCRLEHFRRKGHRLLCVGCIDMESGSHPLVNCF